MHLLKTHLLTDDNVVFFKCVSIQRQWLIEGTESLDFLATPKTPEILAFPQELSQHTSQWIFNILNIQTHKLAGVKKSTTKHKSGKPDSILILVIFHLCVFLLLSLSLSYRSVSGKKLCSSCGQPLGKGAAMIIETLSLYFHIHCFKVDERESAHLCHSLFCVLSRLA